MTRYIYIYVYDKRERERYIYIDMNIHVKITLNWMWNENCIWNKPTKSNKHHFLVVKWPEIVSSAQL